MVVEPAVPRLAAMVSKLAGTDDGRGISAASNSEIRDPGDRIVGITEGRRNLWKSDG
jgi:hypothetical protein